MRVGDLRKALEGLDDDVELTIVQGPPSFVIQPKVEEADE